MSKMKHFAYSREEYVLFVFGVTYFYSLDGTLNLKWMCIGQLLEHLWL